MFSGAPPATVRGRPAGPDRIAVRLAGGEVAPQGLPGLEHGLPRRARRGLERPRHLGVAVPAGLAQQQGPAPMLGQRGHIGQRGPDLLPRQASACGSAAGAGASSSGSPARRARISEMASLRAMASSQAWGSVCTRSARIPVNPRTAVFCRASRASCSSRRIARQHASSRCWQRAKTSAKAVSAGVISRAGSLAAPPRRLLGVP